MSLKDHILKHYCKQPAEDSKVIRTEEDLVEMLEGVKKELNKGKEYKDIFKAVTVNTTTNTVHCDTQDDFINFLKNVEQGEYIMKKRNNLADFIKANY